MRPVVFGYAQAVQTPAGLPRRNASTRTSIDAFAEREGFAVAQFFIDASDAPRLFALESLIEAASFTVIAAVVVPDRTHLGRDPETRRRTQQRIRDGLNVPVLTIATFGLTAGPTRPPPRDERRSVVDDTRQEGNRRYGTTATSAKTPCDGGRPE